MSRISTSYELDVPDNARAKITISGPIHSFERIARWMEKQDERAEPWEAQELRRQLQEVVKEAGRTFHRMGAEPEEEDDPSPE